MLMQLATTFPLLRRMLRERCGKVTRYGSVFQTLILGRSAWNTLIEDPPSTKVRFLIPFLSLLPFLIYRDALIDNVDSQLLCPFQIATERNTFNRLPIDKPADLNRLARLAAFNDDADTAMGCDPVPGGEGDLPVRCTHLIQPEVRNWRGERILAALWCLQVDSVCPARAARNALLYAKDPLCPNRLIFDAEHNKVCNLHVAGHHGDKNPPSE